MGNKPNKKKKNKNKEKEPIEYKKEIYKYKIVFHGEAGVGTKTGLIKKIMGDKFIDGRKVQKIILEKDNNKEIRLYLYDIDRTFFIPDYYILGYDVTNEQSFEEIKKYYDKIKNNSNSIYLLGNKIDLKNKIKVTETKAKNFANSENIKYFSISIKDDTNVKNFIKDLKLTIDNKFKDDVKRRIKDKLNGKKIKMKYKAVLLGDSGIGSKTSLLNVVVTGRFCKETVSTNGASYCSKSFLSKNNEEVNFDFWDTAGQEKLRSLSRDFIIDADVIILGFEITKYESYESINNFWYPFVMENSSADLIYLLGNKIDLYKEDIVEYKFEGEVKNFANENNLRYFPISCKTGTGIKEFVNDLVNEVF